MILKRNVVFEAREGFHCVGIDPGIQMGGFSAREVHYGVSSDHLLISYHMLMELVPSAYDHGAGPMSICAWNRFHEYILMGSLP